MDLQLNLFDTSLLPLLIYSCEAVWGYENPKMVEKVHPP